MSESYLSKMLPLIEKAALGAKQRMGRVSQNAHVLWDVYMREKNLLILAAAKLETEKTASLGHPIPDVDREAFENYLISNAVWVETDDAEEK